MLENPFDAQSTQLILAVEQEAQQRLLGRQAGATTSSMNVSSPHAHDSSIKLQQAESMIQHLQRCHLQSICFNALQVHLAITGPGRRLQELAVVSVIAPAFKPHCIAQSILGLCIRDLEEGAPVHITIGLAVEAQQDFLLDSCKFASCFAKL